MGRSPPADADSSPQDNAPPEFKFVPRPADKRFADLGTVD